MLVFAFSWTAGLSGGADASASMDVLGQDELAQVQAKVGIAAIFELGTTDGFIQVNTTKRLRLDNINIYSPSGTGTRARVGNPTGVRGGPVMLDFFTRTNDPAAIRLYLPYQNNDGYLLLNTGFIAGGPVGYNSWWQYDPDPRRETVVRLLFPDGYQDLLQTPNLRADVYWNHVNLGQLTLTNVHQRNSALYLYIPHDNAMRPTMRVVPTVAGDGFPGNYKCEIVNGTQWTWWLDSELEFDIDAVTLRKGTGNGLSFQGVYISQSLTGTFTDTYYNDGNNHIWVNTSDWTNPGPGSGFARIGRPEMGSTLDVFTDASGTHVINDFTIQGTIAVENVLIPGTALDYGPLVLQGINIDPGSGNWTGGIIKLTWDVNADFRDTSNNMSTF
ncbi:MAG: hypothetical protein JRI97_05925 [Deltaproteobacteria bacterium]|nr:hypothetical protein [Deltaproteobacteria bacterium]